MRKERRELELRQDGQLAELLGEALVGEPPAALQRLAREDQRQAEEGLVALTSNGKVYYKLVEELTEGDMAARIAADRLQEAWLKDRRDGWLDYGGDPKGEAACSLSPPFQPLQPVSDRLGFPGSYAPARVFLAVPAFRIRYYPLSPSLPG